MTTTPRYFSGTSLGVVTACNDSSFSALCNRVAAGVELPMSREEYFALPTKEARDNAKKTTYLTAACFKSETSQRRTPQATLCNLVFLDVDDAEQAGEILAGGSEALSAFGHMIWHTASSTPEAPRLRVMVNADRIPVAKYPEAVQAIAALLGIETATRESKVVVQPMYWPCRFKDELEAPVVAIHDGPAFTYEDAVTIDPIEGVDDEVADLAAYRSPVENITVDDIKSALAVMDPDCGMQEWIEVAAAIKHQLGEEGFEVWDEWSRKGKKYDGNTEYRWNSLKGQTTDRAPVTLRSLFHKAAQRGWQNQAIQARVFDSLQKWLSADSRSTEELLDQGVQRISRAKAVITNLQRQALTGQLRTILANRGMTLSVSDLRRAIHKEDKKEVKTGVPAWAQNLVFITSDEGYFYDYVTGQTFTRGTIDFLHKQVVEDEKTPPASDLAIRTYGVPAVENTRYEPKRSGVRIFPDAGCMWVNTYKPSNVEADYLRAQEAGDIVLGHLRKLIREEEYVKWIVDFLAYLVQYPGEKINWAPLIQSAEGAGKSFFAEVMMCVLGQSNVIKLAGSNVIDHAQNDWAYGHQLVVIEEVRIIGQNRHAIMDRLKPLLSDPHISLRCMYRAPRTVDNITNYMMFTNYPDAVAVTDNSRRYFVICSPLQSEAQILALGKDYFEKLFAVIHDNPTGLRAFFETWKISPDFSPKGRAPVTKYLHEMVETSATPLAQQVRQLVQDGDHPLVQSDLLSALILRGLLAQQGAGNVSDQSIASILRELSWQRVDRVRIDGDRHPVWVPAASELENPGVVLQERAAKVEKVQ